MILPDGWYILTRNDDHFWDLKVGSRYYLRSGKVINDKLWGSMVPLKVYKTDKSNRRIEFFQYEIEDREDLEFVNWFQPDHSEFNKKVEELLK